MFLKSRSIVLEFSNLLRINHHHLCHHFKRSAALLYSCTISGISNRRPHYVGPSLPNQYSNPAKLFAKLKTKMICQVFSPSYQFSHPNIRLQKESKAIDWSKVFPQFCVTTLFALPPQNSAMLNFDKLKPNANTVSISAPYVSSAHFNKLWKSLSKLICSLYCTIWLVKFLLAQTIGLIRSWHWADKQKAR